MTPVPKDLGLLLTKSLKAFFGKNLDFLRHWTWKPIFLACWNKKYLKNIINCCFYNSAKYKLFYIPLSRTATRRKRISIFILFQIDTVGFFSCSTLSSTSAFAKEMFWVNDVQHVINKTSYYKTTSSNFKIKFQIFVHVLWSVSSKRLASTGWNYHLSPNLCLSTPCYHWWNHVIKKRKPQNE